MQVLRAIQHASLSTAREANARLPNTNLHLNVTKQISEWKKIGCDRTLLQIIQSGIRIPLQTLPPMAGIPISHLSAQGREAMDQAVKTGALRQMSQEEVRRTRHWTPVFDIPKPHSDKVRVISDLRKLNQCHQATHFKGERWENVLRMVQDAEAQWGITMDSSNYFHHMKLHRSTQRWMRMTDGSTAWQAVAMPFGWSLSPYWAHRMAKPIKAFLADNGIRCCWWVDDILIVAATKQQCEDHAAFLVHTLTNLGIKLNIDKSMAEAAQDFVYLGHHFHLASGDLTLPDSKSQRTAGMLRKLARNRLVTPSQLAAAAGNLLDVQKSNIGVLGLARILMQQAAKSQRRAQATHRRPKRARATDTTSAQQTKHTWRTPQRKTSAAQKCLQTALLQVKQAPGRQFRSLNGANFRIFTDASDIGWGATLQKRIQSQWVEITTTQSAWDSEIGQMHITHRELWASVQACLRILPSLVTGCKLQLHSDSTPTIHNWRTGSTRWNRNELVRNASLQLHLQKKCFLVAEHVRGIDNKRADWLSRNIDVQNYRLHRDTFLYMCRVFNFVPMVDLFASEDNKQCELYYSWRLDPKALGTDALQHDWTLPAWGNPPWALIRPFLQKIFNTQITVLACLPYWKSAPWWPLLRQLQASHLEIVHQAMFHDPHGHLMPKPRWRTLFCLLQAPHSRSGGVHCADWKPCTTSPFASASTG